MLEKSYNLSIKNLKMRNANNQAESTRAESNKKLMELF